jgi:hypothetical protein
LKHTHSQVKLVFLARYGKKMGLFSGLLGNAAEVDVADVETELATILADGEKPEQVFKLIRDLIIFTNRRLIFIDKQGVTGSKKEYMSIPYRSIVRFSAETKGHFDLESDLKIWLSSADEPICKTFSKDGSIMAVQKALATYVCR